MFRNLFVAVLVAISVAGCGRGPTAPDPSDPPPSIVLPPIFAYLGKGEVPVGAVFNEGDEIEIMVQTLGNGGTLAIAFVLSRDGDGGTAVVLCGHSAGNSSGSRSTMLEFRGRLYDWAKGHILNGIMLQADLEDPAEFWRINSCYFLDGRQVPISFDPVRFDKATKRTDYALNWWVN